MSKSYLPTLKLQARIGDTTAIPLRLEQDAWTFASISAMSKSAPLAVTAPAHGMPGTWRAAILDAKGMIEINTAWDELEEATLRRVTCPDANTIKFDGVSSLSFGTYVSGGVLAYRSPRDLSAYTAAKMDLKKSVGGTPALSLSLANSRLVIDNTAKSLSIALSAADKATLSSGTYYFDIELSNPSTVYAVCSAESTIEFLPEITTS